MESTSPRFDTLVNAVTWASLIAKVTQFLAFSQVAMWRRLTFGVLAVLLAIVAITSGLSP